LLANIPPLRYLLYAYTAKHGVKMVFAPKIFLKRGLFTIPAIFGDLDQSDALTNLHAKG